MTTNRRPWAEIAESFNRIANDAAERRITALEQGDTVLARDLEGVQLQAEASFERTLGYAVEDGLVAITTLTGGTL